MNKMLVEHDMRVISFLNGVKLVSEEETCAPNAPTVATLLQLPFSVYFLDEFARTVLINEEGANACGFHSSEVSIGKSLLDVSAAESANVLISNCRDVVEGAITKIFEEDNLRQDGVGMQFLSVKIPWYGADNKIIGVLGTSIIPGKHELPQALAKLTMLGLLNQDKFTKPLHQDDININNVKLTRREMQCLQLTVKGYTAKKVARQLGISFRTVEEYLNNIRAKAGAHSKSDLIEMTMESFYC